MYNPIYISCGDTVLQDASPQNIAPYVQYNYQGNSVVVGNADGKIVAKDFPPFSGFLGDSIAVLMRVGERDDADANRDAKTPAGTVNIYANSGPTAVTRTIARRERSSNIIVPFAASNTATDSVVIDWTRSYQVNYLAVAQVSYFGFLTVSIPLIQAQHSSSGDILNKLMLADSNYAELDSTAVVYLTFANITPPLPNMVRDYVFETKGRYVSGAGNGPLNRPVNQNNSSSGIPKQFKLYQNYPNPFNPVTEINFDLPQNSRATVIIYDLTGKLITTLIDEYRKAGSHSIIFDGTNLASGVYFYRLVAGRFADTKKMIIIK